MKRYTLQVPADLPNLEIIADFIASSLDQNGIDDRVAYDIRLAVDEICSNIMLYGYRGSKGAIDIDCTVGDQYVQLEIADEGVPFNPLTLPDPDIDADLDHRKIGGLGIFFVKTVMDELEYKFRGGRNVLTMKKRVNAPPSGH
ncbi:MAG: ATP-binding protein [Methanomicrobiaceae archaeon]|nr:ATP-binding protein [Methanomicrobiaceae archaeon]